jgi:predicted membrane protein
MDEDRWQRKMHKFDRKMNSFERRWERRWEQRWQRRRNDPARHLFPGLLLLVLGIVFLMGNMGIVSAGYILRFWPFILIAIGVFKLVESGDNYGHSSGIFWIVVGGLFALGNFGILRIAFRDFWPVVLIGIGSLMLWRTALIKRQPSKLRPDPVAASSTFGEAGPAEAGPSESEKESKGPAASSDSILSAMAILGSVVRRNNCQDFRGGSATAVMGRCEIDLRGASIASPNEPVLEVFAMWGGIEIRVPPDWTVVSRVDPIMGGYEDDTQPPKEGSKHLLIRGAVIMGGVEVTN